MTASQRRLPGRAGTESPIPPRLPLPLAGALALAGSLALGAGGCRKSPAAPAELCLVDDPGPAPTGCAPLSQGPNAILVENRRPGAAVWSTIYASLGIPRDRTVEAYATAISVRPGEALSVRASVSPGPAPVSWDVYRFGYYQGGGVRLVTSGGPAMAELQRVPAPTDDTGRIECAWPETFSVPIGADWTSGLYAVRLRGPMDQAVYVPFAVLEPPTRKAPVLMILPTNTWEAYNDWGGDSLYTNRVPAYPRDHADEVSYDRPWNNQDYTYDVFQRDRLFSLFLESQGVDVAYATDVDLDADPCLAQGRELVIIEGHSEYWSMPMRKAVLSAVATGSSLAAFSGNEMYWQVRLAPGQSGAARRTIVGYKEHAAGLDGTVGRDPLLRTQPALTTGRFRDPPVGLPENRVLGVLSYNDHETYTPMVVAQPEHWSLWGTRLRAGDQLPALFGYESDYTRQNCAHPDGLTVIGDSVVHSREGLAGLAQMTAFDTPAGGFVFGGASIDWAQSLAMPGVWDRRAQQIVANVVARAAHKTPREVLYRNYGTGVSAPTYEAPAATVSTLFAGEPLERPIGIARIGAAYYVTDAQQNRLVEFKDGAARVITPSLAVPTGVAVGSDGQLYVTDADDSHVVRVGLDGRVTLLAGGTEGDADGQGAQARFNGPLGLCAGTDGALYVADGGNHALRRVALDGTVTTVSASGDLRRPSAVACAPDGTVYVVDADAYHVVAYGAGRPAQVVAGVGGRRGFLDGPLATALLGGGRGAVVVGSQLVFTEGANASLRRLGPGGIATLAGGALGRAVDGVGPAAGFVAPGGVVALDDGSFVVVDTGAAALRLVRPGIPAP